MIGLITDDDGFLYLTNNSLICCDANYLELKFSKTQEMVIDFRSSSVTPCPIVLKGGKLERVSSYKYLGIVIDDKLSWHVYIDSLIKRLNTRMYSLRKLNRCENLCFVFMFFFHCRKYVEILLTMLGRECFKRGSRMGGTYCESWKDCHGGTLDLCILIC